MPEAAVPLVAEGAVAGTMTAAEIAAAEAAAAAAAEAATAAAVEQAATQAAAQAAAEQAATQAAGQAAQTATNQSVLNTIAQTPVSSAGTGVSSLASGANPAAGGLADLTVNLNELPTGSWEEIANEMPEGIESNFGGGNPVPPTVGPAAPPSAPVQATTLPSTPPAAPPPVAPPPPAPPPPPPPEVIPRSVGPIDQVTRTATPGFDTGGFETRDGIDILAKEVGVMPGVQPTISAYGAGPIGSTLPTAFNPAATSVDQLVQTNLSGMGSNMPPPIEQGGRSLYDLNGIATGNPSPPIDNPLAPNQITRYAPPGGTQMRDVVAKDAVEWAGGNANQIASAATPAAAPEAGGIQSLFNQGLDYAKKNPLTTAMFANTAYNYLNQPKPYEKPKYKSTFNSGAYSGYNPTPPTPYTPNYAHGGLADLGGYSDGGRMLKGPGDGMSDDIPATIANKQPARLANEEFVVPADVVSHLGNGSSEAGAKQLYKMMDRVRQARTGNKKQGKQINPEKYLA